MAPNASWSFEELVGISLSCVDARLSVGSNYDAFVRTCEVIRNRGLCPTRYTVTKPVHSLLAALKEATVAAADSSADARARLRGALLEVAKRRRGAFFFVDAAALDSEWPLGSTGRLMRAIESEGCACRVRASDV